MPKPYWDSFDCQIQCEEIYHEEDNFDWENEDDLPENDSDCEFYNLS